MTLNTCIIEFKGNNIFIISNFNEQIYAIDNVRRSPKQHRCIRKCPKTAECQTNVRST